MTNRRESEVTSAARSRSQHGRRILEERRTALLADLRHDIHDTCAGVDSVQAHTMDDLDASVVTELSSIRFSLMQMKGEALVRVNEALARIDEGHYGLCESCGAEISEARLRALPFAVRCTRCEKRDEDAEESRRHSLNLMDRLDSER